MRTIYIDQDFKCHLVDDGTLKSVETEFFVGKCNAFIEGYRFVPKGESWMREDGAVFKGEMAMPWRPYDELDAAQREYERQQLADMAAELADARAALAVLGVMENA